MNVKLFKKILHDKCLAGNVYKIGEAYQKENTDYLIKLELRVIELEKALKVASRFIGAHFYSSQDAWRLKSELEKIINKGSGWRGYI